MQLIDFDKNFYESIEGKDEIGIEEKGIYRTIIIDGKKAGIVGIIPTNYPGTAFVQILITPEFRGQNLTKDVEEMLAREHGITEMLATIKKDNTASIRAHEKAGFQYLTEPELDELRKKGFLDINKTRLIKKI